MDRSRFGKTDGDKRRVTAEPRVNDQIRAAEIRLVGPDGEQVGVVDLTRARQLAAEVGLDLVEVAPNAQPPVCKIVDYGKHKYDAGLKAREARRNQQQTTVKAMNFRPKIDQHDFETKKGHVLRFLRAGSKVKVTIWFRGRERFRPELGLRVLNKLAEEIAQDAVVESEPRQDGRNMVMVVAPLKSRS
uniref:translation initiation factor IF-3 n=1 Tax=Hamadaea tsunoensis TaxID=53368 RepID=UPI00040A1AF9|nr:translation initiation factor IF-3 [Hamadaea tsunoensis]